MCLHQNTILLLHAAHIEETYKELIALAVCDLENKECMLQRCSNCPGFRLVETMLQEKFEDLNEEISFKQWVSVDRTDLISQSLHVFDYIKLVISKLTALAPHHFISKSQTTYLKNQKENLDKQTALILMDFSENFSFYIQDEAQGYHWTHNSCTVHPVVCYYKNNVGKLITTSFCFLSSELLHDTVMVHLIQCKTINFLKNLIPELKFVEYFSDGCAAQYKNRKCFYNLCLHEKELGVKAAWSFFATSHGKSPCDGIGGTVKRLTAMESLRRPFHN